MVPKNADLPDKPKTPVHRRRGNESVCGAQGLKYGAGLPKFPYPTDWGKEESRQEYKWCENCIRILSGTAEVSETIYETGLDIE